MRGAASPISPSRTRDRSRSEFRKAIGNRIYGCDDCLAVCPWNKFAQEGREAKLAARDELRAPALAELARLDDAAFRALFAKSPVKRIGRDRFIRNVLIAIGNSGEGALAQEAERLLSDDEPAGARRGGVGAGRNWSSVREFAAMARKRWRETDDNVRAEWRAPNSRRHAPRKRDILAPCMQLDGVRWT